MEGRDRLELDSYATLGIAAYEILDNCPLSDESLGPVRMIHGQVYLVGGWHVVIGGDEC